MRMLNIVTMCVNPFAHEKLIVNIKYGPTKHHYKKNWAKQTTPCGAKSRLGRSQQKFKVRFSMKTLCYSKVEVLLIAAVQVSSGSVAYSRCYTSRKWESSSLNYKNKIKKMIEKSANGNFSENRNKRQLIFV